MKLKIVLAVAAVAAAMSFMGCATLFHGTTNDVAVKSSPDGVKFLVKDRNGIQVHQGQTPETVTLKGGDGFFIGQSYTIDFYCDGYSDQSCTIDTYPGGWYFGNIAIGGALGMLLIDPATGAMWSLPDGVDITMTAIGAPAEKKPEVVDPVGLQPGPG